MMLWKHSGEAIPGGWGAFLDAAAPGLPRGEIVGRSAACLVSNSWGVLVPFLRANLNDPSDRRKSAQATKRLGQRLHCKKLQ